MCSAPIPDQKANNKILVVILPLYEGNSRVFAAVTRLISELPNLWVLITDARSEPQNQAVITKLEGLAHITPRLQIIIHQPGLNSGVLSKTLAIFPKLHLNPDVVVILEELADINTETVTSLVHELYENERIGAITKEIKPLQGEPELQKPQPNIVAFKYAALATNLSQQQELNYEKSLILQRIRNDGWDLLGTSPGQSISVPITSPIFQHISLFPKFLLNKLISFNNSIFTLPTKIRNLFDSLRTSFSLNSIRSLALSIIWVMLFVLGTTQVTYFSSALMPVRDWFASSILSTPVIPEPKDNILVPTETQPTPAPTDPCSIDKLDPNEKPVKLIIPAIGLNLDIKSVPLRDGTWSVYDYVANFAEGTSIPNGTHGNTGLFGHDRPQAFASIKKLSNDSEIILLTKNFRFTYQVAEKLPSVNPKEVNVFYTTDEPQLTIITCDGSLSKQRYVIKASFIKLEKIDCTMTKETTE